MDLCHSDLQAYQELAPDQRDFQLVVEKGIRNAEKEPGFPPGSQ